MSYERKNYKGKGKLWTTKEKFSMKERANDELRRKVERNKELRNKEMIKTMKEWYDKRKKYKRKDNSKTIKEPDENTCKKKKENDEK